MVERPETFGEVAHALDGIKAQLSLHVKVFAGAVGLGVLAIGALYVKVDAVEDSTARIETRLDAIEGKLDQIVADAGYIRDNIQTARATPVEPSESVFPGFVGRKIGDPDDPQLVSTMEAIKTDGPVWVYTPKQ